MTLKPSQETQIQALARAAADAMFVELAKHANVADYELAFETFDAAIDAKFLENMQAAFELMGGTQRVLDEGTADPEAFWKIMKRLTDKLPSAPPSDDLQQLLDRLDKETKQ